jgi:hypothetical protein
MLMPPVHVRFEQAVYGSFPFWHRGYGVLARSSGCRPEWLAELRSICQRYGESPAGITQADALFALPLKCGPWIIARVHPLGCDDRDRPGALAFHALFIGRWAYWWAGADPFGYSGALRCDWCADDQDRVLPAGRWTIPRAGQTSFAPDPALATGAEQLASIVTALTQRRRVVVQSSEPIDAFARNVWRALPRHVRNRSSMATWAFDNANQFDLVALPRVARVPVSPSDLVLALEPAGC